MKIATSKIERYASLFENFGEKELIPVSDHKKHEQLRTAHVLGLFSKDKKADSKLSLLSPKKQAEEKKEKSPENLKNSDSILLILAEVGKFSEMNVLLMDSKLINKTEHMLKSFKFPLGTHLSESTFRFLFSLLAKYFTSLEKDETDLHTLFMLDRILELLLSHTKALNTCNLSLLECVGQDSFQTIQNIYQDIIQKASKERFFNSMKEKHPQLAQQYQNLMTLSDLLLNEALSVFSENQANVISDILKFIRGDEGEGLAGSFTQVLVQSLTSKANIKLMATDTFFSSKELILEVIEEIGSFELELMENRIKQFVHQQEIELPNQKIGNSLALLVEKLVEQLMLNQA